MRIFVWEARQRARLTLQQLEQRTGISRSTLNRIENGQTVPRLDQLEAIAAATDTRITALFDSPFKRVCTRRAGKSSRAGAISQY